MFKFSVKKAKYLDEYKIWIKFFDDSAGEVDFSYYLSEGEVFKPLQDVNYFKKFKLINGTISWDNGADFAPEFLHNLVNK